MLKPNLVPPFTQCFFLTQPAGATLLVAVGLLRPRTSISNYYSVLLFHFCSLKCFSGVVFLNYSFAILHGMRDLLFPTRTEPLPLQEEVQTLTNRPLGKSCFPFVKYTV